MPQDSQILALHFVHLATSCSNSRAATASVGKISTDLRDQSFALLLHHDRDGDSAPPLSNHAFLHPCPHHRHHPGQQQYTTRWHQHTCIVFLKHPLRKPSDRQRSLATTLLPSNPLEWCSPSNRTWQHMHGAQGPK